MRIISAPPRIGRIAAFVVAGLVGASAHGQEMHHQHAAMPAAKAPVFIASTAKPFAALMDDAMAVMDEGMKRAPMNGTSDHDFVTMMIPHHQGAVDMAKALLLYTKDPELRNVAQGIITEQQNEIRVMQAWLQRYQAAQTKVVPTSIPTKE
ncbi:MAG: DUF305 domain-containing protein [Collimonas sp.]